MRHTQELRAEVPVDGNPLERFHSLRIGFTTYDGLDVTVGYHDAGNGRAQPVIIIDGHAYEPGTVSIWDALASVRSAA